MLSENADRYAAQAADLGATASVKMSDGAAAMIKVIEQQFASRAEPSTQLAAEIRDVTPKPGPIMGK